MSYRPITDVWILARPKVKFYGAYPNGFLERERRLLPVRREEPVLHVCGGRVKEYPTWARLCPNDVTCDLDPAVQPDIVWNVAFGGIPRPGEFASSAVRAYEHGVVPEGGYGWRGILADPDYTEDDAEHHAPGRANLPNPRQLLRDALDVLTVGGRIGILHYKWPRPPATGVRSVACVGVVDGFDRNIRCFSVFEKE